MTPTYARPATTCTGKKASGSRAPAQLNLPLFREVSTSSGLITANSTATEKARRFLARHVPGGMIRLLADKLDAKPSRLSREMEGRALLSVDGFTGFAHSLNYEDRLRLFTHVLAPFGFRPVPGAVRDIDDSAAG